MRCYGNTMGWCNMTDDERENYEERAAILEHDGGMPRDEAERMAYRLITEASSNNE